MGCTASKPGLVNEFRDVKLEQIQNAKLTPPTVGQVVAQPAKPAPVEAPKKPNLFDPTAANLTFANVVWNTSTASSKPALKGAGPPAAEPKKAEAKAPAPEQPKAAAVAAPAPVAWPVRPDDAWAQDPDGWDDDYDEDEDEEDDAAGRVVDPDMFRTHVNNANLVWEGKPDHTDVAPRKDDKQMVNPFAGAPIALPVQAAKAAPPAAAAPKASPLEQAANAIKAAEAQQSSKPMAAATIASPFAGGAAAAKPAAKAAVASPFAGAAAAKPLAGGGGADAAQQAAAMQSILMNGTPEQQAMMRQILQNQAQAQAAARSRAQAAFGTGAAAAGGVYPAVQHAAPAQAVPNGYTNEMLMQQIAQARAMQQQQLQAQALQQQQRQAAAGGWAG